MDEGSDVDITENGPAVAQGVTIRRKVVQRKTKGMKLRQQNADRYKGYEERKQQMQQQYGWSDGEQQDNKQKKGPPPPTRIIRKGFHFK